MIRSLEMQHLKLLIITSRIFFAYSSLGEVPQRPDTYDINNNQLSVASVQSTSFIWHFVEFFVIGFRTRMKQCCDHLISVSFLNREYSNEIANCFCEMLQFDDVHN